ncbi:hypothetical protein ES708_13266 [subsurface metagenome]
MKGSQEVTIKKKRFVHLLINNNVKTRESNPRYSVLMDNLY